ncbi:MAG: DUF3649 domain-containing protein [Pseudoxanthomonas sp.]
MVAASVSSGRGPGWRWRAGVASRATAAIAGGYLLASIAATALAVWLPLHRAEAVITATLASFVVYLCAVLWVFAARTALKAWLGIGMPAAVLAAALAAAGHGHQLGFMP